MKIYTDFRAFSKNQAYWERNQLVAALSKLFPAWLERHPESDKDWDDEWRNIVFIEISTEELENKYFQGGFLVRYTRQLSWHIHDDDLYWFSHLETRKENSWDGHTTNEKYRRLMNIIRPKRWWEFWKVL